MQIFLPNQIKVFHIWPVSFWYSRSEQNSVKINAHKRILQSTENIKL
jgi:hypothetical protein